MGGVKARAVKPPFPCMDAGLTRGARCEASFSFMDAVKTVCMDAVKTVCECCEDEKTVCEASIFIYRCCEYKTSGGRYEGARCEACFSFCRCCEYEPSGGWCEVRKACAVNTKPPVGGVKARAVKPHLPCIRAVKTVLKPPFSVSRCCEYETAGGWCEGARCEAAPAGAGSARASSVGFDS